ncbi:hypothetical protein VPHD51_0023 [Vibrio phage D51]
MIVPDVCVLGGVDLPRYVRECCTTLPLMSRLGLPAYYGSNSTLRLVIPISIFPILREAPERAT